MQPIRYQQGRLFGLAAIMTVIALFSLYRFLAPEAGADRGSSGLLLPLLVLLCLGAALAACMRALGPMEAIEAGPEDLIVRTIARERRIAWADLVSIDIARGGVILVRTAGGTSRIPTLLLDPECRDLSERIAALRQQGRDARPEPVDEASFDAEAAIQRYLARRGEAPPAPVAADDPSRPRFGRKGLERRSGLAIFEVTLGSSNDNTP